MKSSLERLSVVGGLLLITLFFSCGKDATIEIGTENEIHRKITLKLKAFDSRIVPIQYLPSENSSTLNQSSAPVNTDQNVFASDEIQYLYIWSFNDSTIRPDIGIDRLNADISVLRTNGQMDYNFFNNGYSFLHYSGGRSLNSIGPEKIIFHMPINQVEKLGLLRFDMSGSTTGPKDFSIYYQLDSDEEILISGENQFSSLGGKNTYEYDLSEYDLGTNAQQLNIIIIPREGDRADGANYNQSTGTLRIDNFALQGIYLGKQNEPEKPKTGILYYHIFDQLSGEFVVSGQKQLIFDEPEHEVQFNLEEGLYQISILVNNSTDTLYFSDYEVLAEDFYIQSLNEDQNDMVFGTVITNFEVKDDIELDIELDRYYSEIGFEFEDNLDWTSLQRIEVEPLQSIYYSPFNPSFSNPEGVQEKNPGRIFYQESFENGAIRFNQFLGFRGDPIELTYRLSAYDRENRLLNQVMTTAEITHNMRLIFSGYLLGSNTESGHVFRIDWESPWKESIRVNF